MYLNKMFYTNVIVQNLDIGCLKMSYYKFQNPNWRTSAILYLGKIAIGLTSPSIN